VSIPIYDFDCDKRATVRVGLVKHWEEHPEEYYDKYTEKPKRKRMNKRVVIIFSLLIWMLLVVLYNWR
jgi:hypothetical protein